MDKKCNLKHKCDGKLFDAVTGGYVCEAAIKEQDLNKCKWCGKYGSKNVMCRIENTDLYECKYGFGCRDYIEEDLEEMLEIHHFCFG